jgi:hypothetical protein
MIARLQQRICGESNDKARDAFEQHKTHIERDLRFEEQETDKLRGNGSPVIIT